MTDLRRWLLATAVLFVPAVASAQTTGSWAPNSGVPSAKLNAVFSGKADTTNGILTNPIINGTPLTGPVAQIGTTAGMARDAAAAIAAETAASAAAAAAASTANAAIPSAKIGAANGVVATDGSGKAVLGQLPTIPASQTSGLAATANNGSDFASASATRANLGVPTGTSGAVLGFLNASKTDSGSNTYSGTNAHTGSETFGTVNYNSSNVTTAPLRWNISGSLTNGGTIGAVQKITNTGGLNNVGILSDYYSASLSPGFDDAYTWYGYADPVPLTSPVTFTGSISGTTLTLLSACGAGTSIPKGVILSDSGSVVASNTIVRGLASGTDCASGATYTVSISQTVASEAMSAINGHAAYYNNFSAMICPNTTVLSYGCAVAEWNVVNRGPDAGFMRFRGDGGNATGGLLLVPEAETFSDPAGTGGIGTNATYAFDVAHSGGNGATGYPAAFYTGYLVEPNSIAPTTGRGIYETGDITNTIMRYPYAPVDWDGNWLHGLVAAYATLNDGGALTIAPGQSIVNIVGSTRAIDQPPTTPTATGAITATGSGAAAGWNITTAGTGQVDINGTPIPIGSEVDTFSTPGTYTWTKNTAYNRVSCIIVGGGSGGGAGFGPTTSGTQYSGGAGGSGGYVLRLSGPSSAFPSSAAVVVGAGGAGGTTSGAAGSAGGQSSFNGRIAYGAGGSAGGQTNAASASGQSGDITAVGGSATGSTVVSNNSLGTAGSLGTGVSASGVGLGATGAGGLATGASRGGGSALDGASGGGDGGGMPSTPALVSGGFGGSAAGSALSAPGSTAGAAGSAGVNTTMGFGTGGGGGANNIAGTGGAGGAGGVGAGGGGGGDGLTAPGAGGGGGNGLNQCVQSP